jgi:Ca-activated chloride channel family protein
MKRFLASAATLAGALFTLLQATPPENRIAQGRGRVPGAVTEGTLLAVDKQGQPGPECPLKHTDVKADITGFLARVTVTQEFQNNAADKIEAVYVFPLPRMAAVDRMDMYIGERHVRGDIKRREEARAIYEAARDAGKMAALLDQERPNIFTQHVANIRAGDKIRIVISYVEHLKYEDGNYEWVFPMVVGPRYIPGNPIGKIGGGWAPDTDRVPDASKITPHVTKPGTRAGHDLSLAVSVDAGVPLQSLSSKSHDVLTERPGANRAIVRLKDKDVIPNKDFILKYDVSGSKIEDAVLTHRGARGGFFTMICNRRTTRASKTSRRRNSCSCSDTSGFNVGLSPSRRQGDHAPRARRTEPSRYVQPNYIRLAIRMCCSRSPCPATAENLRRAQQFLAGRTGGGGTEMMKAITAALAPERIAEARSRRLLHDGRLCGQ